MSVLIKSRERVKAHGEVFTPPWIVEDMLDLLPPEKFEDGSTFLEPAAGNGNFVLAIMERIFKARTAKGETANEAAVEAIFLVYSIELLEDNVKELRRRVVAWFWEKTGKSDVQGLLAATGIIMQRHIQGDYLVSDSEQLLLF